MSSSDSIIKDVNRSSVQRAVKHAETEIVRHIQADRLTVGAMLPGHQELAKICGVAPATVQRAIANLATRGVVRSVSRRGTFVGQLLDSSAKVAESGGLHFRASELVRKAKATERLTIGVVASVPTAVDDYVGDNHWSFILVRAIERALSSESRVTVEYINRFRRGAPDVSREDTLEKLRSAKVDGVAFVFNDDVHLIASDFEMPSVIISSDPSPRPTGRVYYGDEIDGYQAAEHLIDQGYRRITVLSPFSANWATRRIEGVRQAVADSAVRVELNIVEDTTYGMNDCDHMAQAHRVASTLEWGKMHGSAIIATNDTVGQGVISAGRANGKLFGVDYGLLGFDDEPVSRNMGITSLHPPLEDMGREGITMLLQQIRNNSAAGQIRLKSHLIPRQSTRPLF